MKPSPAGKGSDPRPMSREGKKNFDATMREVYGTKVKIPPPGLEREEMAKLLFNRMEEKGHMFRAEFNTVGDFLDSLEDLAEEK